MSESDDLVQHIAKMRRYKDDLEAMETKVTDDDFAITLLASLPDSWDLFTSSYLGSHSDSQVKITSGELIKVLIDENTHREVHKTSDTVLMAQPKRKSGFKGNKGNTDQSWIVCHNCGKSWAHGQGLLV